jgi:hypothetical protein
MSMNLHCTLGGNPINLRQTPTRITHLCLVQPNGKVAWRLTGQKAKHALAIYREWLMDVFHHPYSTPESLHEGLAALNEERAKILKVLKSECSHDPKGSGLLC